MMFFFEKRVWIVSWRESILMLLNLSSMNESIDIFYFIYLYPIYSSIYLFIFSFIIIVIHIQFICTYAQCSASKVMMISVWTISTLMDLNEERRWRKKIVNCKKYLFIYKLFKLSEFNWCFMMKYNPMCMHAAMTHNFFFHVLLLFIFTLFECSFSSSFWCCCMFI